MEETKPLLNKKILFLSPAFFGYEKKIKNEMENITKLAVPLRADYVIAQFWDK